MTREDLKKSRHLAAKWLEQREVFGDVSAEFVADSFALRLLRALTEVESHLDRESNATQACDPEPAPAPSFKLTKKKYFEP